MRISKRSRHTSKLFQTRFDGSGTEAAPLRHLQRAREDLIGAGVQAALLIGLAIALAAFARAALRLFDRLGEGVAGWVEPAVMLALGVVLLLLARRIWSKFREIRDLRHEVRDLREKVSALRAQMRRRD